MEYFLINTRVSLGRMCVNILQNLGEHLKDHVIPHPRNHYRPHVLHHRSLGLLSLLLLSVKILSIAITLIASASPAFSSAIVADNVFQLTNKSRVDFGVPTLVYNKILEKAAQAKADDMLAKGYFAHTNPDGKSPWEFIKSEGYSYVTAGENLAWGFPSTCAECVEEAWMNSPGHKANIINKHFEEIGIGISQGQFEGHTSTFVVQMFGTPLAKNVATAGEPTVVTQGLPVDATIPAVTKSVADQDSKPVSIVPTPVAVPSQHDSVPDLEQLKIIKHSVTVENEFISMEVATSNSANKVVAVVSGRVVPMKAAGNGTWKAIIPLSVVGNSAIAVSAYDIAGNNVFEQIANFSNSLQSNYDIVGNVKGDTISIFGRTFNPKAVEQQFYLLFVAAMLTCLVIAIVVHRHIQHVSLIANSSFVIMLAMLLFAS